MSVFAAIPWVGSSLGRTWAPFGASSGAHVLAGAFALLAATVPAYAAGPLTDTGITSQQCYAAGSNDLVSCKSAAAIALNPHQDGMTGLDVEQPSSANGKLGFRYRKIGADGQALLPTATEWSCVKDLNTGLMWELKTADGGLHDQAKTFTNYDSTTAKQRWNGRAYVRPTRAQLMAPTNSLGFVAAVNAAGLCGHKGWRLPTADELQSLVDYGVGFGSGKTAIDATFFPGTQFENVWPFSGYWTSSPLVGNADTAWVVSFNGGGVGFGYRDYAGLGHGYHVRLVRSATGI